jgi:hypothetical protein
MSLMRRSAQLALLLAIVPTCEAAEPGWYLGAAAGAATHDVTDGGARGTILVGVGGFGIFTVPRTALDTDTDDTGWRGLAGYRFGPYLAAELEYLDFGTSRVAETYEFELPFVPEPVTIDQQFAADVSGPALSALGILPLGGGVELFARAGVLFADSKVRMAQRSNPDSITYADRVLIGGIGIDWNFSGRWSARLEYQRSKDIEPNLDLAASHVELLSLGVLYRL